MYRTNLDLIVVGQVTLASNVCEQVRYIAEFWLLGANVAKKRYVGRHCSGVQQCNVSVRSVLGVEKCRTEGQWLQRDGVEKDTKGAC